ncbi:MAG: Maf family protein [Oceanobacter sp.]
MNLLLASSSPYRQQQLSQLGIPFEQASPDIDETPLSGETIDVYVQRLAEEKAKALQSQWADYWIIGSDQSCSLDGEIVGKPGNFETAFEQLKRCSGKQIRFHTGVALLHPDGIQSCVEHFDVQFRKLSDEEITSYLRKEEPYDCAGSFKVEGLGIHLFEHLDGRDINSLIGLPLIALLDLMRSAGLSPLELTQ